MWEPPGPGFENSSSYDASGTQLLFLQMNDVFLSLWQLWEKYCLRPGKRILA